jgi:nucleotide-binding universal stress UspA family protein
MYERIVIPVDGSEEAKHAAQQGLRLAEVFDASVNIIHVIEQKTLRLSRTTEEKKQLRDRSEGVLTEIEELASDVAQSVTTTLTEGKPSVQISTYADEKNADLVVIGRQGMTGLGKRLLGGVTEQVLHQSNSPVLVVPNEVSMTETASEYARLLISTDGSETAESATQHGVEVAQHYDSIIHVLTVVDLQVSGGVFNAGGLEKAFVERLEANGHQFVDKVSTEIEHSDSDLEVETKVTQTTSFNGAAVGIREYVTEHDIDLVVMGSHGRSNLKTQFLGSVASTVLRTVDVPVLVVKRTL